MSKTVTLQIQGMHCKGCALGTKAALMKLPQVQSAQVEFPAQTAVLAVEEALYNPDELTEAVRGAGFEVMAIS
jgi:copper chaperone CopZ